MIYLSQFHLPSKQDEDDFFFGYRGLTCYDSVYPFQVFPVKGLSDISFSEITIFAGGNGSGKSTLLNIITEKLEISRTPPLQQDRLPCQLHADVQSQFGRL